MITVIKMRVFTTSTIICILFLIGLPSYAQQFNVVVSSESQYPIVTSGNSIPLNPGQAVLKIVSRPYNVSDGVSTEVLSADIIPTFSCSSRTISSHFGWVETDRNSDLRYTYSVIDSSHIYVYASSANQFSNNVLTQVQRLLVSKGLGTVSERRRLIALYNGNIAPSPVVIVHYIKPWVVIGFAIFLSLPLWWLVKRALR